MTPAPTPKPAVDYSLRPGFNFTDEHRAKAVETRRRKAEARKADRWGAYLENLRNGMQPYAAAQKAGLSPAALKDHRSDPTKIQEEVDAEAVGAEPVEAALRQAALSGSTAAAKQWLENRSKQRWSPPAVEVNVNAVPLNAFRGDPIAELRGAIQELISGGVSLVELGLIPIPGRWEMPPSDSRNFVDYRHELGAVVVDGDE